MRRILAILALGLLPVTLPGQRVASERVGVAPRVALATRPDAVAVDSVAPHRSRAYDAVVGGAVGAVVGGFAGLMYAKQGEKHCGDGPCLVGLAIPFLAGIGLVVGAVAGALWPTH